VVTYKDHVILNCEDLARKYNYGTVFYYQRVGGEPLFFFHRGKRIGLSYAGQEQFRTYDAILHNPPQELARYDIRFNDQRVWFYGYRGHHWYFVDATATSK